MEWLGSIAWDGHPDRIPPDVIRATSDVVFRANVARFLDGRDDSTRPEHGWPWPWDDSRTTDYAYTVREGAVHASPFGHEWFRVDPEAEDYGEPEYEYEDPKVTDFPDMSARKNVRFDGGSGLIILGGL